MEISEIYRLETYDYTAAPGLIAQYPVKQRDKARLLIIDKKGGMEHRIFSDIRNYLRPGDVLVLNNTKVIPASIKAIKEDTGGKLDLLLLRKIGEGTWEIMCNSRLKHCHTVSIGNGMLRGHVINEHGRKAISFQVNGVDKILKKIGLPPLPPYIKRNGSNPESDLVSDRKRYQTVYAESEGSIAAPTAGLHFTASLLSKLKEFGVEIAKVTLHVGPGTFIPVRAEDIRHHNMETEHFYVSVEAEEVINKARADGRRIIAVGTTTTRVLESVSDNKGRIRSCSGSTNLFIYSGYCFKTIDALITNFHLPKSTLFMLVSAFAGIGNIRNAYNAAIEKGYRFYSYGDAMLIFNRRDV